MLCVGCHANFVQSALEARKFTCPCCQQKVPSYITHEPKSSGRGHKTYETELPELDSDESLDFVRRFVKGHEGTDKFTGLLMVGNKPAPGGELVLDLQKLIFPHSNTLEMSATDKEELQRIAKKLHALLITPDKDAEGIVYDESAVPTERSMKEHCRNDRSLLNLFCFGLGYGKTLDEFHQETESISNPLWDKIPMTVV